MKRTATIAGMLLFAAALAHCGDDDDAGNIPNNGFDAATESSVGKTTGTGGSARDGSPGTEAGPLGSGGAQAVLEGGGPDSGGDASSPPIDAQPGAGGQGGGGPVADAQPAADAQPTADAQPHGGPDASTPKDAGKADADSIADAAKDASTDGGACASGVSDGDSCTDVSATCIRTARRTQQLCTCERTGRRDSGAARWACDDLPEARDAATTPPADAAGQDAAAACTAAQRDGRACTTLNQTCTRRGMTCTCTADGRDRVWDCE